VADTPLVTTCPPGDRTAKQSKDEICKSPQTGGPDNSQSGPVVLEGEPPEAAGDTPASVVRLTRILNADPVDLARVSEEIRGQPGLEALVLRLAASLVLSEEGSILKLEEAAVVLGTDRLRVLTHMWSLLSGLPGEVRAEYGLPGSGKDWSPEAFYIASFLRCLAGADPYAAKGSETPSLQSADLAALKTMLMRDFVSLIPALDPSLLIPRQTAVRES